MFTFTTTTWSRLKSYWLANIRAQVLCSAGFNRRNTDFYLFPAPVDSVLYIWLFIQVISIHTECKMLIQKAYKYRLNPTDAQAQRLRQMCGCARFVWNYALAETQRILETRRCSRCLKNTPARLTGACWPPSPGRNPTGIRRPPPLPACAV